MNNVELSRDDSIFFKNIMNLDRIKKHYVKNIEYKLKEVKILEKDENTSKMFKSIMLW